MHPPKIRHQTQQRLQNLQLNIHPLIHTLSHRLYDLGDGGERDGGEGDEALEGAEGDSYDFGGFGGAAHEDGAEEVFGVGAI